MRDSQYIQLDPQEYPYRKINTEEERVLEYILENLLIIIRQENHLSKNIHLMS